MINNNMFTKRIQEILTYYKLSASAFAEKMGVGRSSISHITSGRNKPSLEFVLHILENFEEVTFEWLMYGKGNFPKTPLNSFGDNVSYTNENKKVNTDLSQGNDDLFSIPSNTTTPLSSKQNIDSGSLKIDRIVIFYSDNTFKEYKN